jgi:hypothetical protein
VSRNYKVSYLAQSGGNIYLLPQGFFNPDGQNGRTNIPINTEFMTVSIGADSDIDTLWVRPDNARDWYQIGRGQPLPPPPPKEKWRGPLHLGADNVMPSLRGSNQNLPATVLGVAVSAAQWRTAFTRSLPAGGQTRPPLERPWLSLDVHYVWPSYFPVDRAPLVDGGSAVAAPNGAEELIHAWVVGGRTLSRLTLSYGGADNANVRLVSLLGDDCTQSGSWVEQQLYPATPVPGYITLNLAAPSTTLVIDREPLNVLALFGSRSSSGGSNDIKWKLNAED